MNATVSTLIVTAVIATVILFFVGWRWASRAWSLPCPSPVGWALESPFYGRITRSERTLNRIGLKPGRRVLEIGPGPGRLLIPAAQQVLPGGKVVGIDIQPRMVDRLSERAKAAKITGKVDIWHLSVKNFPGLQRKPHTRNQLYQRMTCCLISGVESGPMVLLPAR